MGSAPRLFGPLAAAAAAAACMARTACRAALERWMKSLALTLPGVWAAVPDEPGDEFAEDGAGPCDKLRIKG